MVKAPAPMVSQADIWSPELQSWRTRFIAIQQPIKAITTNEVMINPRYQADSKS